MSIRQILTWPDPRLKNVALPISDITSQIEKLAEDMLETMYDAPGRGLAAPQIGEMVRLVVMDPTWKEGQPSPLVMVNPEIRGLSDQRVSTAEGCLSIPGVLTEVSRPAQARVAWTSLTGARLEQVFDGFAATCVQHEIDHLDGIITFDRLSGAARARAEAEYEALR